MRWEPALAALAIVITPGLFTATAQSFAPPTPDLPAAARRELYAARYEHAVELYRQRLDQNPGWGDGYYGLVRALLRSHHSREAYTAAELALREAPQRAGAQTAAGLASVRRGDITKAEICFREALKLDPAYPGALAGLAGIYSVVSHFKTARDLSLKAYRAAPDDPELARVYANSLKGADHIAALRKVLAIYDPASEEARGLRVHIGTDEAVGDRKLRRLVSHYAPSRIKLYWIYDGPQRVRGAGIHVQVNGRQNVRLLLDTGASGISLAPRIAEKAGLEKLGVESNEAKGIGDERPQESAQYIASEIRAGDVAFADVPVSVFRSAHSADFDGLIGADVFQRFLISIDFPALELTLEPRQDDPSQSDQPEDASAVPPPGFQRAYRSGTHLTIFTSVNQEPARLFLIDSGSTASLIDAAVARESTSVYRDETTVLSGVQGKVKQVSRAQRVSLVFAGFKQDNSDLVAFDLDKLSDSLGIGTAGVLGLPVLGQLKLTIDYRSGDVRFERSKWR